MFSLGLPISTDVRSEKCYKTVNKREYGWKHIKMGKKMSMGEFLGVSSA